jgi:hypothetical protein
MNEEQRSGYALALKNGARKTAALIRASKVTVGPALISACREIGTSAVVKALSGNGIPAWSFVLIRYAPGINEEERKSLLPTLDNEQFAHAEWTLHHMSGLPKAERDTLTWLLQQRP